MGKMPVPTEGPQLKVSAPSFPQRGLCQGLFCQRLPGVFNLHDIT